jgi:hypothetical protein
MSTATGHGCRPRTLDAAVDGPVAVGDADAGDLLVALSASR